jgi:hypothetical protein
MARRCIAPLSAALVLAVLMLGAPVSALPAGAITYFNASVCPKGWTRVVYAEGRGVVSITRQSEAGITVNKPLTDREDRHHTHSVDISVVMPTKDIAAAEFGNHDSAKKGTYSVPTTSAASASGYPFVQLLMCRLQNYTQDTVVPYGAVMYFDPDVISCPTNWAPLDNAKGRFIIPGLEQSPVASLSAPLSSGEDRLHAHGYTLQFSTGEMDFVGASGCCNHGPGKAGKITMSGTTKAASSGIPYVQLLTCVNQAQDFQGAFPGDGLVFTTNGCPKRWVQNTAVAGRMPIALPSNATAGAVFGRSAPLKASGTSNAQHEHTISGEVTFPAADVALFRGCCAHGYATKGTYAFSGPSDEAECGLPYLMMPMCAYSGAPVAPKAKQMTPRS